MISRMHGWLGLAALATVLGALSGCGGDGGSGGSGGTGGTTASGGTTNSGGTTSSGGSTGGTTGGTGGTTTGKMCGGIAGIQCAADEYCDFPDDQCGAADGAGECKPRPQGCPDIYMPVCMCNGMVGGNDCDAQAQGQDMNVLGGCTPPDGMMACGAHFCDKSMYYCQRTTSDVVGYPDSFSCMPLPADCGATPTCACLANENCSDMCAEADGGLTLTCPGG